MVKNLDKYSLSNKEITQAVKSVLSRYQETSGNPKGMFPLIFFRDVKEMTDDEKQMLINMIQVFNQGWNVGRKNLKFKIREL